MEGFQRARPPLRGPQARPRASSSETHLSPSPAANTSCHPRGSQGQGPWVPPSWQAGQRGQAGLREGGPSDDGQPSSIRHLKLNEQQPLTLHLGPTHTWWHRTPAARPALTPSPGLHHQALVIRKAAAHGAEQIFPMWSDVVKGHEFFPSPQPRHRRRRGLSQDPPRPPRPEH